MAFYLQTLRVIKQPLLSASRELGGLISSYVTIIPVHMFFNLFLSIFYHLD